MKVKLIHHSFFSFAILLFSIGLIAQDDPIVIPMLPVEMRAVIQQSSYLKASNLDAGDYFGRSVAVDNDTLVVGAEREAGDGSSPDDDSLPDAGAVYVFVRHNWGWMQQAYLKASNPDVEDYFGYSVALDGDTLVVGAPVEDGDGSNPNDDSLPNAGAVYVFVRQGDNWVQQAYLKASNPDVGDYFGYSVALDGDTLVVGAYGEYGNGTSPDDNSLYGAGAAYVFVRQGDSWAQQAYLKANNPDLQDYFGLSLALQDDMLVIGAPLENGNGTSPDNNSLFGAGAVYVFLRQGDNWVQQAYLKASNPDRLDSFGWSLALEDDTLVVGAYGEAGDGSSPDDNSLDKAGAAYVFVHQGDSWVQQAYLKASNADSDDYFGWSLALEDDTLVIGALFEDGNGTRPENNSLDKAGAAYVFVHQGDSWVQQAYLKAGNLKLGNLSARDNFGRSVAMEDDTLIVGAHREDGNGTSPDDDSLYDAGAVYVFDFLSKQPKPIDVLTLAPTNPTRHTATFTPSRTPANTSSDIVNWIAPVGTIESIGNPVYQWTEVAGSTAYEVYVGPAGSYTPGIFFGTVPASVCMGALCSVNLTTQANTLGDNALLTDGDWAVFINPDPGNLNTWQGPFEFTVDAPQPSVPTLNGVTNGDTISFTLEGDAVFNASFYLYLAPQDDILNPAVNGLFTRQELCGTWDGTTCSYTLPSALMNGTNYALYMQSSGAGGAALGGNLPGLDGWQECKFTPESGVCSPPPTEPTNLSASYAGGTATLTWEASVNASDYMVWAGIINPLTQAYFDTVSAADLGCDMGDTCTLTVPNVTESGTYSWFVQASGPGGVPQNDLLGWTIGPEFSVR